MGLNVDFFCSKMRLHPSSYREKADQEKWLASDDSELHVIMEFMSYIVVLTHAA